MIAKHVHEFSKNAYRYDAHNALQQSIADYLIAGITARAARVVDLGCGSGAVCKRLTWNYERFVGIDSAPAMCALHPQSDTIEVVCDDFESQEVFQAFLPCDLLISSSALQWANDLEALLSYVATRTHEIAFAVFTDRTFQTLYDLSGLPSFLPNAKELRKMIEQRFTCRFEIKTFELFFEDSLSLFRYIKKSGVSGGQKRLSVAQTKQLIQNYPQRHLEFEVLFVWGTPSKA